MHMRTYYYANAKLGGHVVNSSKHRIGAVQDSGHNLTDLVQPSGWNPADSSVQFCCSDWCDFSTAKRRVLVEQADIEDDLVGPSSEVSGAGNNQNLCDALIHAVRRNH
jgi:hypothetical protein